MIAVGSILFVSLLAAPSEPEPTPTPSAVAPALAPTPVEPVAVEPATPRSKLPGRGPDPAPTPAVAPVESTPAAFDEAPLAPSPSREAEPATAPAPARVHRRRQRPPRAIRWRVDPFLDLGTMRTTDPGYRALDDGPNLVQFGAGIRVDARVRGPLFLGGGVRYGLGRGSGYAYQSLSTDITMHEPRALLRASVVLLEGLDVVAQLEGGAAFARSYLDAWADSESWESSYSSGVARGVLGVFDAKAGLSLYLPKQWLAARGAARVTAGFEFLLGYGYRSNFHLRPVRDDADGIRVVGADLGSVAVRGLVWSTGLFVRFM